MSRVLRGGSWNNNEVVWARAGSRNNNIPENRNDNRGARCARGRCVPDSTRLVTSGFVDRCLLSPRSGATRHRREMEPGSDRLAPAVDLPVRPRDDPAGPQTFFRDVRKRGQRTPPRISDRHTKIRIDVYTNSTMSRHVLGKGHPPRALQPRRLRLFARVDPFGVGGDLHGAPAGRCHGAPNRRALTRANTPLVSGHASSHTTHTTPPPALNI